MSNPFSINRIIPFCVTYFDNYAKMASLLSTGTFKLGQLKRDDNNV